MVFQISTAASSITQLLFYNAVKRSRKDSKAVRHSPDRETALLIYLGLLLHNKTRKRDLIDIFFEKGLSVSYDRVLQLSTEEGNRVIELYENEGIVCPSALRDQLFTTGNFDNIDHNPSSTSSLDSFHGTAISVTQHVTHKNPGIARVALKIPEKRDQKKLKSLPTSYTDVPPINLPDKVIPTTTDNQVIPVSTTIDEDEMQTMWLEHVKTALADEIQDYRAMQLGHILVGLLCQLTGICTQASCNCRTASNVPGCCTFTRHGEAWNGHHQTDHSSCQSRPDTSVHC